MSWRVVSISKAAKLDVKLGALVVRAEKITKIHLSEIHTLIIENTAISLTAALLCELVHRKIKVIFCNEKRNPHAELVPHYGCHDTSAKIRTQLAWHDEAKKSIWAEIIRQKIWHQATVLEEQGKQEAQLLFQYRQEVEPGDTSNREGHAAKVYFNALFGKNFHRNQNNAINAALNYGYAILLSAFNREIVASGYLTQLGIHHDNTFNTFNLSSDFMEPYRPLVDRLVIKGNFTTFEKEEKHHMLTLLSLTLIMDEQKHYVSNAIKKYCKSLLEALQHNNSERIRLYTVHHEL